MGGCLTIDAVPAQLDSMRQLYAHLSQYAKMPP